MFYRFLFLSFCIILIACTDTPDPGDPNLPDPQAVLDNVTITLPQPQVFRKNILSERGIDHLDSLSWQSLQLYRLEPYQRGKAYFLSAQIATGNPHIRTMLILADYFDSSDAWLANFTPDGQLVDHLLVFHTDEQGSFESFSTLREGILKVTMQQAGDQLVGTFSIDPEGKFVRKPTENQ